MSIRAVIFDYGGVIIKMVDEKPRQQLAERLGVSLNTLYFHVFESESASVASRGKLTFSQHWEYVCQQLHVPKGEEDAALEAFLASDGVDQNLIAWVRILRKQFRTAILSNAWDNLRGLLTNRWLIDSEFDEIIISAEVGLVKPDLRIYELAVQRLGVRPEEAVFFDDVLENIQGAQAAGLKGFQYKELEQAKNDLISLLDKSTRK